ncbi:MAG TPA: ABC transporter permease [Microbacteriaceae bacterium]|nr:ABC transporter permease [Microbacteriaceae bacterium]
MTNVRTSPTLDAEGRRLDGTGPGAALRHWWGLNRWWITRIAVLPVHIMVFAVIAFFLVRAVPGDPVLTILGGSIQYTQDDYDRVQRALGLDGGLGEQLVRYLGETVRLDLGKSMYTGRAVADEMAQRIPETLELALIALIATVAAALAAASVVVLRPRSWVARLLRVYSRMAGAVPQFILAVALIFIFYATLRWAPAPIGRTDPKTPPIQTVTGFPLLDALMTGNLEAFGSTVAHLVLPVIVMVLATTDLLLKILIASLDKAIDAPPTLFRAATGASRGVLLLSAYRRALPPMVTMSGVVFGHLLGGAVILEALFGLGAMGGYALEAVNTKDMVALQGFLLVSAVISLVLFLVVDLVNMALDPRRRPGVHVGDA